MTFDWPSLTAAVASMGVLFVLIRLDVFKSAATAFVTLAVILAGLGYLFDTVVAFLESMSPILQATSDLVWLTVAALLLVSLANFLRDDKPPFARYPFVFTLLPLIVLPVYPFIADTVVIKAWILGLYQFGALSIAFLLFSLMASKDKSVRLLVLAVLSFGLAWIVRWVVEMPQAGRWVYTMMVVTGMILATKTFYDKTTFKPLT